MLRSTLLLAAVLGLAGCGAVGYYTQAVRGHFDLMDRRVPIETILADPATDPALRARLTTAREARAFAVGALGLPDNGSYESFVALDRRAVVWNVFATPRFSLAPKRWCFPVAGCVVYRGYFREGDALAYAAELEKAGYDTWVGGAAAYSTLGRFADPLLSTMLAWDDARLAGTLFHELAHQQLYVEDDSAFNEAFATAVEEEGVRRWLEASGREAMLPGWRALRARIVEFEALLGRTRARLAALYASGVDEAAMAAGKAEAFAALEADYRALKAQWGGWTGYDRWFEGELNNARLVPSATYRRYVPAFARLLREAGGDLEVFYRRCETLAALDAAERNARLRSLLAVAGTGSAPGSAPR